MIKSERISGHTITVMVESSNLKEAVYDTQAKTMMVIFNNNRKYNYHEVPWEIFTKFRMAESQGAYLSREIIKKYKFNEVKDEEPIADSDPRGRDIGLLQNEEGTQSGSVGNEG